MCVPLKMKTLSYLLTQHEYVQFSSIFFSCLYYGLPKRILWLYEFMSFIVAL